MKVLAKISFAMLLVGFFASSAQAQILDRLERKVETKVERRVDRKVDRSIDKGLDKAEDGLDDATKKKEKEDSPKPDNRQGSGGDSLSTSMHWLQYREHRGSFEDLIDVQPGCILFTQIALLPKKEA